MSNTKLENTFNECLEAVLGGEGMVACLERFPAQAAELKPLLEMSAATIGALRFSPRPELKALGRSRVLAAVSITATIGRRVAWGWGARLVTAGASLVLAVTLSGGLAMAASGSMPGQALYPVKLASEQVALALTSGAEAKAELYAGLAGRRVAEIVYLSGHGDAALLEITTGRMSAELNQMAGLLGVDKSTVATAPPSALTPPSVVTSGQNQPSDGAFGGVEKELKASLGAYAASQAAALNAALASASADVRNQVAEALLISVAGYERALDAIP